MKNLVGLGTQEIEGVMVLAVTNRPFDLDEAIIEKGRSLENLEFKTSKFILIYEKAIS